MAFDWQSIVRSVAPTVATALGGPLAGLAVKAIGDALGIDKATEQTITARLQGVTSDDLLKLKQADQEFAAKMQQMSIDVYALEVKDRDSARQLVTQGRAWTPSVLSWIVTIGFFALNGYLIMKGNPEKLDAVILGRILGTLDTAFGVVLSFWLGTSFSSRSKDETIGSLAKS